VPTSLSERAKQEYELYKRLYVYKHDFYQVEFFAMHLLKKNWHFDEWDSRIRQPTYMQQAAFTTALVTAYGRPFSGSNGFPTISMKLLRYTAEQKALHFRLLDLRNNVYAHSNVERQDVRPRIIQTIPAAIIKLPAHKLSKSDAELTVGMVQVAIRAIEAKLQELASTVAAQSQNTA
jgi:hypothetical protein